MQNFRFWRATDARDKIYGLLALTSDGADIKPDYHISVPELFIKIARMLIAQEQSIDILSYSCFIEQNGEHNIPSWCPD